MKCDVEMRRKIKKITLHHFLDYFIRCMIQVFFFDIIWTETVAVVTENGCQKRLEMEKMSF